MELRRRARSGEHDTIDGLSAATMAQIRRIEVLHPRMYPGFTREALRRWESFVRSRSPWTVLEVLRGDTVVGCGIRGCCPTPVDDRELLWALVCALRRPQARELRARIRRMEDLHGLPEYELSPSELPPV